MKILLFLFLPIVCFSQQIDKVDFIECNATVFPKFENKSISGNVTYLFKVNATIDSIKIDAKNMLFSDVVINGKTVNYKNNNHQLVLFEGYKKGNNTLNFSYKATPKQTLYFTNFNNDLQIWTQGQGKNTSFWLPSFDDVNEKVIFNVAVNFNKEYEIISNGVLSKKTENSSDNTKTLYFKMKNPMASYLVMMAIGNYNKQRQKSKAGIALEYYLAKNDSNKFEPTYRYSKTIFDYLSNEIGVKFPWKIYRQVPVRDFLYAGMENTSSTIFAQDFVVDSIGYNDRNYCNVNAHELAHQWFGDLITAKSGKQHWLQEGFATYYALLAEKEFFGDDYFYYKLYKNAQLLKREAKTDTIAVLNEKASSYSYYEKGAWALHTIREAIGAEKFQKAIKNYLKKYQYKNVETDNFLEEIKKVSNFDTEKFKKNWLENYHFQTEEVNQLLQKNKFIKTLFEIQSYKNKPFAEKENLFAKTMISNIYYPIKIEIINQINDVPFAEKEKIIRLAMQTNNLEVHQSVAETIDGIPADFKIEYETLLNDASYDTKQTALVTLWKNFPNDRPKYYEIAKNWIGKNDKELRITYLTLYQLDKQNTEQSKADFWSELLSYTSPNYETIIRQNAIENGLYIQPENTELLKNLINGTTNFRWQFVKFSKDKIRELVKKENYRNLFENILPQLPENEKNQLQKLLLEK